MRVTQHRSIRSIATSDAYDNQLYDAEIYLADCAADFWRHVATIPCSDPLWWFDVSVAAGRVHAAWRLLEQRQQQHVSASRSAVTDLRLCADIEA